MLCACVIIILGMSSQITQLAVSGFIMCMYLSFAASWPTNWRSGMQFVIVMVKVIIHICILNSWVDSTMMVSTVCANNNIYHRLVAWPNFR